MRTANEIGACLSALDRLLIPIGPHLRIDMLGLHDCIVGPAGQQNLLQIGMGVNGVAGVHSLGVFPQNGWSHTEHKTPVKVEVPAPPDLPRVWERSGEKGGVSVPPRARVYEASPGGVHRFWGYVGGGWVEVSFPYQKVFPYQGLPYWTLTDIPHSVYRSLADICAVPDITQEAWYEGLVAGVKRWVKSLGAVREIGREEVFRTLIAPLLSRREADQLYELLYD